MVQGRQSKNDSVDIDNLFSAHNIRLGLSDSKTEAQRAKRIYLQQGVKSRIEIPSQSRQVAGTLRGCFAQEAWTTCVIT